MGKGWEWMKNGWEWMKNGWEWMGMDEEWMGMDDELGWEWMKNGWEWMMNWAGNYMQIYPILNAIQVISVKLNISSLVKQIKSIIKS